MFDLGESVEDYANARAREVLGEVIDYLEKQRKVFYDMSMKRRVRELRDEDMLLASVYESIKTEVQIIMCRYED